VLGRLRAIAARLFRGDRLEHEIDEELRSHVALRADDLERGGLSRAEAERRARIEFGGHLKFKEDARTASGGVFWETLLQDLRFASRMLRKSRSFTGVAVFTLALTIGANAVVFAALNAFILKPLNVPRAESLYSIHRVKDNSANQSYPDYMDLRDRNRSFEDLAGYDILEAGLEAGDETSHAWTLAVTGNYFDALGIQPQLGHFFHAADEHGPNSIPAIVLSHAYWHAHFHDDPGVIGREVRVNKQPLTVLGVAPPRFNGTLLFFAPDFFVPIVDKEQLWGSTEMNQRNQRTMLFLTFGHLKPGVTPRQAEADLNAISLALEKTYPSDHQHLPLRLERPSLYGEFLGGPMRAFLTGLMLLSTLVLLAACANLGSLFAARAADRSRELAVRLALGASRGRLLRQLFTEAVLVSLLGGALGWGGSVLLLRWLSTWQPFPRFPLNLPMAPDATLGIAALLLAVVSGLLFGAVPVRQVLRTDPYAVIKSGPTSGVGRRLSVRDVLLVAQIAICALLVTSSFVAVRGLVRSLHGPYGFEPGGRMLASAELRMAGYRGDAQLAMQRRMIDALASIPGVRAVGTTDCLPLTQGDVPGTYVFREETTDIRRVNAAAFPLQFDISPDYLRAAGVRLLSGRTFTWHDDAGAPQVAVLNQVLARQLFGSEAQALGRVFKQRDGTRTLVVGIVENGKYEFLAEPFKPAMYLPVMQTPASMTCLVVESDLAAGPLAAAMRARLRELDPGLPVFFQSWTGAMGLALFPSRVAAVALGVLGVMAALLSITGIFGLAAYAVSRRLKELGIRVALGASHHEILRATLSRPFKLLACGSAAGLALGLLASTVLSAVVYEATPRDPLVLTGVVAVMLLLGLVATWIPARRALSADPLTLLREE
jgi:predicted permease